MDEYPRGIYTAAAADQYRRFRREGSLLEAGMLLSTVSGTAWPQHERMLAGISAEADCQLCRQAEGTLWHRHMACDATAALRRQHEEVERLGGWAKHGTVGVLAIERAVLPDPLATFPEPAATTVVYDRGRGYFSGIVYTDGSGIHGGGTRRTLRVGWGGGQHRHAR